MVFGSYKLNYYQIKQHIIMSNFAAFKHTIEQIDFSQFLFGYGNIELVLAELLCCDCERVLRNSLYFMFLAVVSAGYPALLSSSYFERINDDDDDECYDLNENVTHC